MRSHVPAFDVVVVGGGSAGCALAARLAAGSRRSVLLAEAGPDLREAPPELMHDGWRTYRDSDWGLESEPDDRGEVEPLFRGKVVGGSSWMTRFAMRGSPHDYDEWVRLGSPGWGFDHALPFFTRLENDLDFGSDPWHGEEGPIPVTRYPGVERSSFEYAVEEACASAGIAPIEDHNRPGAVGAARMPRNSRDGIRVTSADGYLPSNGAPASLTIMPNAEAATVLVDRGQAIGIRLVDGSEVDAGWVVLCAGTYGSPAMLLRSGIGPADDMRKLGLEVHAALPGVGTNLADHPGFDVDLEYRGERGVAPRFFWLATFRSSLASEDDPPDLALWIPEPFSLGDEPAEAAVTAVLLTPRSRGVVRLRSADSRAAPAIKLPGLEHPDDVERLAEGAVRAAQVAGHAAVTRLCGETATALPGVGDGLRAVVRQGVWSYPHVVGTCAMGRSPDEGAVVDASGDVYGIARLSIADASIIPTAPSGFPHLIAVMIAERMAELVGARL
jgi:choline dehydrogenase